MTVQLGKDRKQETASVTATKATAAGLTVRAENTEHNLYGDNFFSCPEAFDDLHNKTIKPCIWNCSIISQMKHVSNPKPSPTDAIFY